MATIAMACFQLVAVSCGEKTSKIVEGAQTAAVSLKSVELYYRRRLKYPFVGHSGQAIVMYKLSVA